MGLAWYVPFPKSPACWAKDPLSLSLCRAVDSCHTITQMSQNRTRLEDQAKGHCSSSHNQCASQAQTRLKKSHEKKNKSEIVTFSPLSVGFALSVAQKLHSCLDYLLVRGSWFLPAFLPSFHPSFSQLFI